MPKPYSEDLRRKVIEAYESTNMKIKEICKVFNITRNWMGYTLLDTNYVDKWTN
ncbi:hypothetical protein [Spiroplasma ixodetis]|uniref:Transposase n=1 Tax=Spiroplasma ixodetis TaxID=2141 RepID=A0ABM8JM84_9MOLU